MTGPSTFDGPFLALPRWSRAKIIEARKTTALVVLCTILEHMNVRTKCATISISDLSEESGLSKETVKRNIRWLTNEGIIGRERTVGGVNTYRVVYRGVGSPVTLGGVTSDPSGGSAVTLGGVTSDPSKVPKNESLAGEMPFHNRIVLESGKRSSREDVCDDLKEVSMIIGESSEREEEIKKVVNKNSFKEIDELVRRFIYSKNFCMRTFTNTDVSILRRAFKLLLQAGLSVDTIHSMIDSYINDSRFFEYKNPVAAFSSKKIQKILLDRITVEVTDDDPIIMFMVNDFVRQDLELPWSISDDILLRKVILSRSLESLYRYPEVIANIIKYWADDFQNPGFLKSLSSLESLVKIGLGTETGDTETLLKHLSFVPLPKTLITGNIRPSAGNLAEAAYVSRRANRV